MSCLIVFRSITYAQSANALLNKIGIPTKLARSPLVIGKGSCSYALFMQSCNLSRARTALEQTRINVGGYYERMPSGEYREASK